MTGNKPKLATLRTVELLCENCEQPFLARLSELKKAAAREHRRRFCSTKCQHESYQGEGNPKWRGGEALTTAGYIYVYRPDHPYATKDGYVMKHRLVAEKHLGRYLTREEQVHHKNKVKTDNRWRNLKVMASAAAHRIEHAEYEEEPCGWCGKTVLRSRAHRQRWDRKFCDRKCAAAYGSKKSSHNARIRSLAPSNGARGGSSRANNVRKSAPRPPRQNRTSAKRSKPQAKGSKTRSA